MYTTKNNLDDSAITISYNIKILNEKIETRTLDTLSMQPTTEMFRTIREAAQDRSPVTGLTHLHYKYPARFSPKFVRTVLHAFSKPNDLILDPYMGGGTTVVEAIASQRRIVGSDVNSLAVFVTRAKTIALTDAERQSLLSWAHTTAQSFSYRDTLDLDVIEVAEDRTRNLHLPRARAIKKYLALALDSCARLETENAERLARAVLLNVSQWALNGKKSGPSLSQFRTRVATQTQLIIEGSEGLRKVAGDFAPPTLVHSSAEHLADHEPFRSGIRADMVITSPPYPGVHMLYHRWQVDGRRETPAPYWIANCLDGQGGAYYNFGDRKQASQDSYFEASLRTLRGVRRVMKDGAIIVQLIAFSDPRSQLPRYLKNMQLAGFSEVRDHSRSHRIWRKVPRRSWHAELQGNTSSSREVVLIHRAC